MTALVLQARTASVRLPAKSLLPLGGRPLIFRVMEALAVFPWELKVLACPEADAPLFAPLAEEAGFALVPGPADDVLSRYCAVIRQTSAGRIVRATGDNPFVFVDAAAAINREASELGADYAGYGELPYGAGVESLASEALLRAEQEAKEPFQREHVAPYLYGHPELFRLHRPPAPEVWRNPKLRLTVDTREDYERALALYGELCSLPPEKRVMGKNIMELSGKLPVPDNKNAVR